MPSKNPIAYIDIRVFAHATEDINKVLDAVRNVLPTEHLNAITFKTSNLSGYHGNPITLIETRIKEKNIADAVFRKVSSGLSVLDKELLNSEIQQHLEKGNLYFRLDKQSAFLDKLKPDITDPIHFRVHFKKHKPEDVVSICREYGLLP